MARLEELIGTASNIWQAGTGRADLDISGVTADSRQVQAGYLFAALPGSRADGKLRLKGKGLPTASGGHGDLFITLQIVMPPSLSDEERKLYEQLGRIRRPDPRADLLMAARRG